MNVRGVVSRFFRVTTASIDDVTPTLWTDTDASRYAGAGECYQTAILEQYKTYVEMADRVSARRGLTNTFFLTLNTLVITAAGLLWRDGLVAAGIAPQIPPLDERRPVLRPGGGVGLHEGAGRDGRLAGTAREQPRGGVDAVAHRLPPAVRADHEGKRSEMRRDPQCRPGFHAPLPQRRQDVPAVAGPVAVGEDDETAVAAGRPHVVTGIAGTQQLADSAVQLFNARPLLRGLGAGMADDVASHHGEVLERDHRNTFASFHPAPIRRKNPRRILLPSMRRREVPARPQNTILEGTPCRSIPRWITVREVIAGEDEAMGKWRGRLSTIMLAVAAVMVPVAAPAAAAGRGTTVRTTINIPAMVVDNLCNLDVVSLSGDLRITTVTTPARDGGYAVRSSAVAPNLHGTRIAPLPSIGYRGTDAEHTASYYAPPPYPSTHGVVHRTTLIPEGAAPRMTLVLVLAEAITADGTVLPVLERTSLECRPGRPGPGE